MATSRQLLNGTFDAATELKDAGAVIVSGAAQVAGAARVVNVGKAFLEGVLIVDFDALDVTSLDEGYEVRLQGSNDATFATDVNVISSVRAGTAAAIGESANAGIGRRTKPFINQGEDGLARQYLRLYHVLTGTTPSVNYRGFITKDPL